MGWKLPIQSSANGVKVVYVNPVTVTGINDHPDRKDICVVRTPDENYKCVGTADDLNEVWEEEVRRFRSHKTTESKKPKLRKKGRKGDDE